MSEKYVCLECIIKQSLIKPASYTVKGGKCPECGEEPRVLANVDGWSVAEKQEGEE